MATRARNRKVSLTRNPLGKPESPIHLLATKFQDYLHFPDPMPLYAVMGTVAANMMSGNKVWLMLVGPPSCGKTQLLNSLMQIPGTHGVSTIKGPGALLSGVPKKEVSRESTGGLLRQVGGDGGCIVLKDFTSILSLPRDPLKELLSAFREMYDGKWDRPIGSDGGRTLTWAGRLAMLAGCTGEIDAHHQIMNSMGERWMFYRYPDSDGFGESRKALNSTDPEQANENMAQMVAEFFESMQMNWKDLQGRREFEQSEWVRLISMASIAAKARSSVVRHNYTREIEDITQPESPARISTGLGQLYLGLEVLGLEERERWKVVGKIALDCMPNIRHKVLNVVRERGGGVGVESTIEEVQGKVGCSIATIRRTVEDMQVHGILDKGRGGSRKSCRVSDWAEGEFEKGWDRE